VWHSNYCYGVSTCIIAVSESVVLTIKTEAALRPVTVCSTSKSCHPQISTSGHKSNLWHTGRPSNPVLELPLPLLQRYDLFSERRFKLSNPSPRLTDLVQPLRPIRAPAALNNLSPRPQTPAGLLTTQILCPVRTSSSPPRIPCHHYNRTKREVARSFFRIQSAPTTRLTTPTKSVTLLGETKRLDRLSAANDCTTRRAEQPILINVNRFVARYLVGFSINTVITAFLKTAHRIDDVMIGGEKSIRAGSAHGADTGVRTAS
jgi:hypothetical protein